MTAAGMTPAGPSLYPTNVVEGWRVRHGEPYPLGATPQPGGVTFSIQSIRAEAVVLVLFREDERDPSVELPYPDEFRVGGVWSMTVFDLDWEGVEYGFRVTGPDRPGVGDRFDPSVVLADPYARSMNMRTRWGESPDRSDPYPYRCRIVHSDFDWSSDQPPRYRAEDLVIYETHVRGFTQHPTSQVSSPGTYAGLVEKIPYLKSLGITCVELMPVFEFDEHENSRTDPATGRRLLNYWGYSTVGFFAPKAGYASTGSLGTQVDEFKNLVAEMHAAGIAVVLDVVFNHTAEGNENGPSIHFRGIDNSTWYLLTPEGYYYNFSGTGNTVNCNHPVVRDFILSCLRYWTSEYHIDGFRFDLAAILDRGEDGAPMSAPPLIEALAYDPLLSDTILIAEAWDAGGLYEVGSFPNYGRWSEWNGRYRDCVRSFLKSDRDTVGELAARLVGSPDLYGEARGPRASVNFLTAHDGFTLRDLVSYNEKHNGDNAEGNADGADDNLSWNCGSEGPTDDVEVQRLRARQARNAFVLLLLSQGVPMILAGDEVGRSQGGNNNGYCIDSDEMWFDWSLVERNADLLRFVRTLLAFRAAHPLLRGSAHPRGDAEQVPGYPEVSWHGVRPWQPDWSPDSHLLAMMRSGTGPEQEPEHIYLVANMFWEAESVEPPALPPGYTWRVFCDTAQEPPGEIAAPGLEPALAPDEPLVVAPRSCVVLRGAPQADDIRGDGQR